VLNLMEEVFAPSITVEDYLCMPPSLHEKLIRAVVAIIAIHTHWQTRFGQKENNCGTTLN
jgi:hypothetical protein